MILTGWADLTVMGKVYWIIAISSTAIFAILFLLSILGGDTDTDGDIDTHDGDINISEGFSGFIISTKSILSFLMMFGWSGVISRAFGLNIVITLIVALGTGLIALFSVAGLLYILSKMTSNGTLKLENAIGKTGQVVLRIPGKRSGIGQIQINIQGSLRTLEAVTEEEETIKSETPVVVIDINEDNTLLVVPKR